MLIIRTPPVILRACCDMMGRLFRSAVGEAGIPPVLLLVVVIRALFLLTYPPNFGGDAINYYAMLVAGKSNLVHAPGYPFLLGLPWRHLLDLPRFSQAHPDFFSYLLIASQHLCSILVLLMLHRVVSAAWGRLTANVTVLLYGCNPLVMGDTSCFYPEWLQANLFILTLYFAFYGSQEENWKRKVRLYTLMMLAFVWCYLTKFNALFLAAVFPFVLLFDRSSLRKKISAFLIALALPAASLAGFLHFYHKPSTGTYALSRDHAWVLLTGLGAWAPGGALHPEAGISTKRLLYLNRVLPWKDNEVGPVERVDYVPQDVREPYRQKYLSVLTADEATLDKLLAHAPPLREPFNFFTAFHPTFKYIGVREGDELGIRVFREHVRAFPAAYLKHVWGGTVNSVLSWTGYPFFPLNLASNEYERTSFGFFARRQTGVFHEQPVWYRNPYVWGPGVWVFAKLDSLATVSPLWFILVLGVGWAASLSRIIWVWRVKREPMLVLMLTPLIVLFMACTNAILPFRWKEALLVLPVIFTLFSASVVSFCDLLRRL